MRPAQGDKETKNIFNAIWHYTLFNCPEIKDEFFKVLIDKIDLSNISDRDFFSNDRIKKFVDYERISKKQLIRLITRDPEILNKVNIGKFRFKIKDLQYFLKLWPEYINLFNFDIKNVTGEELIILLSVDVTYAEKVDFEKIIFAKYQLTEFLQKFLHRKSLIRKALICQSVMSQIDNFQMRQIIISTGTEFFDLLDVSKLNDFDWFEILKSNREMLNWCDTSIFEKNDCYLLVKLLPILPELESLVVSNKEKISNLGWEKLLRYDFEKFYPLCCFECLDYRTRKMFLHKLEPR
jgi:hypothetical protein